MLSAVLGLLGALVYGSADFFGGVAARRIGPLRTTAIGAVSGLVILLATLPLAGGRWSAAALGWGALSGLTGTLAVTLLYACLAIGPMSILSPLTALVSALVPMAWGLAGGDRFPPIGYAALGLALVAVVLVGFVPEKGAVRPSGRALAMAVAAGALIGVFLILLDQTPTDSGTVPLIANRAVNGAVMGCVVGVVVWRGRREAAAGRREAPAGREEAPAGRREAPAGSGSTRRVGTAGATAGPGTASASVSASAQTIRATPSPWRRGLALATIGGALDASANLIILLGLRAGELTTMSVLVALYPAGTILLAAGVLRERIAPVQWVGLVLAVAAAGMLAVA